jgi:HD-like signal output (HDOD) protein
MRHQRTDEQQRILDELVVEVEQLSPLPEIAARIVNMSENDRFSAQDLATTIIADQALTVKILRLANSAFLGLPRRIGSVRESIVLLGFREVKATALTACVIDAAQPTTHLDYEKFWLNSVITGMLSEVLAKAERHGQDEAFTAGLLHNVGRLALDQHRPEYLGRGIRLAHAEGITVHDAQLKMLGFTDADLGAGIVRASNFPPLLCDAVAHHAASLRTLPDPAEVDALVVRARRYARANGIHDGVDDLAPLTADSEWLIPPLSTELEHVGGIDALRRRAESLLGELELQGAEARMTV